MATINIEQARYNMIKQQVHTWNVLDRNVLDILEVYHREDFMPADFYDLAFADASIPIGHGEYTMTPKLEARLLQSLQLKGDEHILEVGTGSGYLSALLGQLTANTVHSIDIHEDFISDAKSKLAHTKLSNIKLTCTNVYDLLNRSKLSYDVIVLTGSLPHLDERFLNLLNEHGKMFAIIGRSPIMSACLIHKQDCFVEDLFETELPALIGAEKAEQFIF